MLKCHSLKVDNCLAELKTDLNGLTQKEAEKRLGKYGPNEITEEKTIGWFKILIAQFNNPLAYILMIAGGLSLVLGVYVDAGVIFGAVIFSTVIKPQLKKTSANIRETSAEMKMAMREIRWNPWRLLHNPSDKELRTQNILTAARSFSSGASDIDAAFRQFLTQNVQHLL